jgi:hypothetical protein
VHRLKSKKSKRTPGESSPDDVRLESISTPVFPFDKLPRGKFVCSILGSGDRAKLFELHTDKSRLLEIRDKVYAHLLVNEELGQARCLMENTNFGSTYAYRLDLSILWTCKWVYEEALDVLYGSNVFVFVVGPRSTEMTNENPLPITPLARYYNVKDYETTSGIRFKLDDVLGINRVMCWRIIYGINAPRKAYTRSMARICEIISEQSRFFLDVAVIVQKIEWVNDVWVPYEEEIIPDGAGSAGDDNKSDEESNIEDDDENHWDDKFAERMEETILPLQMLRQINKVKVRHARQGDLSPVLITKFEARYPRENHLSKERWEALKRLIKTPEQTSNAVPVPEPVPEPEKLFEMFAKLLRYAQKFERNELFCEDMIPFHWYKGVLKSRRYSDENPYLKDPQNVEGYLNGAALACRDLLNEAFYSFRQKTLDHLEPQYARMVAGFQSLQDFVEETKRHSPASRSRLPEPWYYKWQNNALDIVEKQAVAFERDAGIKATFLLQANEIHLEHLSKSALGTAIRKMETTIATINPLVKGDTTKGKNKITASQFWEYDRELRTSFKLAVEDLVGWFMDINETRQVLLDHDVSESPCQNDFSLGHGIPRFDWSGWLDNDLEERYRY